MPPSTALMRAMNFTAADLQANRAGHITPRQVGYIRRKQWALSALQLAGLVLIVGMSMVGLLLWWTPFGVPVKLLDFVLQAVGLFILFIAGLGWIALFTDEEWEKSIAFRRDLSDPQVLSIQGRARIGTHPRGRFREFFVAFGKLELKINEQSADQLEQSIPYTVYYLPHTRIALSAELTV